MPVLSSDAVDVPRRWFRRHPLFGVYFHQHPLLMALVLNALLPILLVIALGYWLRRSDFFPADTFKGCNALAYWVCLPTLLVAKIGAAPWDLREAFDLILVLVIATLAVAGCAWLWVICCRLPAAARGVFIQAASRGNLAFIGLPVIVFATAGLPEANQLMSHAVLALGPVVVVYNIFSVLALTYWSDDDANRPGVLGQMIRNPILLACLLGLVLAALSWQPPQALADSLQLLAGAALPLALLGLGASLAAMPLPDAGTGARTQVVGQAVMSSVAKVALAPLLGWTVGMMLGVSEEVLLLAMLYLATPTAVASFVLVDQIGGDRRLAALSVCLSTIFSFLSLAMVLLFRA